MEVKTIYDNLGLVKCLNIDIVVINRQCLRKLKYGNTVINKVTIRQNHGNEQNMINVKENILRRQDNY